MGAGNATASSRSRKIPIVVVPGTMGTRLTDPATNNLIWNPPLTGSPGAIAGNATRLQDTARPLDPDETHKFPQVGDRERVRPIRHFYNVLPGFYGKLLLSLHYDLRTPLGRLDATPVVFACGYDWRQDNARSAARLAQIVTEARNECDGENVILIAHSMGGLVCRHFCKNLGGEAQVSALFLIASPTHGAPEAYVSLRNGIDTFFPLRAALGFQLQETNRQFLRRMPSVYQLVPTRAYGQTDKQWLTFDPRQTGFRRSGQFGQIPGFNFSDCSNMDLLLLDIYTGLLDDLPLRSLSERLLIQALGFHNGLSVQGAGIAPFTTFLHPNTFIVFNGSLEAVTKADCAFQGVLQTGNDTVVSSIVSQGDPGPGDETVPQLSAVPGLVQPTFVDSQEFTKPSHQQLPGDSDVVRHIRRKIIEIVRSLP